MIARRQTLPDRLSPIDVGPVTGPGLMRTSAYGQIVIISNPVAAIWDALTQFCSPVAAAETPTGDIDIAGYGPASYGPAPIYGDPFGGGGGAPGSFTGTMPPPPIMDDEDPAPTPMDGLGADALQSARQQLLAAATACDKAAIARIQATAETAARIAPARELQQGWRQLAAEARRQKGSRCEPAPPTPGPGMGGGADIGPRPVLGPPAVVPPTMPPAPPSGGIGMRETTPPTTMPPAPPPKPAPRPQPGPIITPPPAPKPRPVPVPPPPPAAGGKICYRAEQRGPVTIRIPYPCPIVEQAGKALMNPNTMTESFGAPAEGVARPYGAGGGLEFGTSTRPGPAQKKAARAMSTDPRRR